jgi:regulator of chromosome condensation
MKPDKSKGVPICDVFVHGSGECDQLGLGEGVLERKKPTCIKSLIGDKIISIAVGSLHNLALTADGRVYSWGCNDDGALGRTGEENIPLAIPTFDSIPIKAVRVGDCHSAFIDYANRVWICGTYKDSSGHIGFPDFGKGIGHIHHKQIEPICVQGLPPRSMVEDVVCGANHTLILLSPMITEGTRRRSSLAHPSMGYRIMSIGNDEFGQLGLGARDMDEHGRSEEDTVMLKHTSRSRRHQKAKLFPRDVVWNSRTGGGIKRIYATAQTSFIQTRDNALYACGLNNFGQLGFGYTSVYPMRVFTRVDSLSQISTENDEIVFITGGTVHSAARTVGGFVYAWGRRDYSGMPPNAPRSR